MLHFSVAGLFFRKTPSQTPSHPSKSELRDPPSDEGEIIRLESNGSDNNNKTEENSWLPL
jgi:hypothetical protein